MKDPEWQDGMEIEGTKRVIHGMGDLMMLLQTGSHIYKLNGWNKEEFDHKDILNTPFGEILEMVKKGKLYR